MVAGERSARGIVLITLEVLRGGGSVTLMGGVNDDVLLCFIHLSHSCSA